MFEYSNIWIIIKCIQNWNTRTCTNNNTTTDANKSVYKSLPATTTSKMNSSNTKGITHQIKSPDEIRKKPLSTTSTIILQRLVRKQILQKRIIKDVDNRKHEKTRCISSDFCFFIAFSHFLSDLFSIIIVFSCWLFFFSFLFIIFLYLLVLECSKYM